MSRRASAAEALAYVSMFEPHLLPLFRAAAAGAIELGVPMRETTPAFLRHRRHMERPACVLVGDDDHASTGPAGWRCAPRLAAWANAVVIHAAGGEQRHYRIATAAARVHRRLVLVETNTAHSIAWMTMFEPHRIPLLLIRAPAGRPHPRLPDLLQ